MGAARGLLQFEEKSTSHQAQVTTTNHAPHEVVVAPCH